MDPEQKIWFLLLSFASLGLVSLTTLARQIYPALARHVASNPQDKLEYEKYANIGNSDHFVESLSLIRVSSLMIGSWSAWMFFQPSILELAFKSYRYWIILPIALVFYLIGLLIPRTLCVWKRYLLAGVVHIIFAPLWALVNWVGILIIKLQKYFYKLVAFDPQFSFLTEEERKQIDSDENDEKDHLEEDEKMMIRNIIEFGETPVQEIMTPRLDITALKSDASLEEVVATLNSQRHSRVPVYKNSIDNIIGILHTKDFLEWYTKNDTENFKIKTLIRPPILVSNKEKIDDLMRELRISSNHMAIVVDEYGGTDGIITLEDILEEIVGDIYDEDDEEDGRIQQIQNLAWIVVGSVDIDELSEFIEHPFEVNESHEIETFGGLIQATIGGLPRRGQEIEVQGLRVKILKMNEQRIERVLIEKPLEVI